MSLVDPKTEADWCSACLLDHACLEMGVGVEHLATPDARRALAAMLAVRGAGSPLDAVSLRTELERQGMPQDRSWSYVQSLMDTVPPDARTLAARIRLYADARRIGEEGALGLSHAGRLEVDEARERFAGIAYGGSADAEIFTARGLMEAAAVDWHEISETVVREARGEAPRYVSLRMGRSAELVRIGPGELCTIAAATGVGKSSMALTLMTELEDRGIVSGLVSVEDGESRWGSKLLGYRGRLDTRAFWHGAASRDDWTTMTRAVTLAATRADCIRVARAKSGSVDEVVALMSRMVRVHKCRVLFVDYLQAIQSAASKNATRRDAIDHVLARLLSVARHLDVPLVLMSQLSRAEKGGNRFPEPHLSDLKESGTIENSSDAVVMMWILTDDPNDRERFGWVKAKLAKYKLDDRGARWAMKRRAGQVLEEEEFHEAPTPRKGF